MKAEADSRVSPVSFLNAKPRIEIFFDVTVLNMRETISLLNRRFWNSFIKITCTKHEQKMGCQTI